MECPDYPEFSVLDRAVSALSTLDKVFGEDVSLKEMLGLYLTPLREWAHHLEPSQYFDDDYQWGPQEQPILVTRALYESASPINFNLRLSLFATNDYQLWFDSFQSETGLTDSSLGSPKFVFTVNRYDNVDDLRLRLVLEEADGREILLLALDNRGHTEISEPLACAYIPLMEKVWRLGWGSYSTAFVNYN